MSTAVRGRERIVFLVPGRRGGRRTTAINNQVCRSPRSWLTRQLLHLHWSDDLTSGGTLNLLRHCEAARRAGADAVLATSDGQRSYDDWLGPGRRFDVIRWRDRRREDICVIPDIVSWQADNVKGRAIVYQQSPLHLHADFDYRRAGVSVWTDSPFMLVKCEALFPGKDIPIVPNVVDDTMFPFVPQARRVDGLLFAFPRKNPEFIDATWHAYRALGGRWWRLERLHGLPFQALAGRFGEAQGFLASARHEGCALPPQEAMASGIVVVGRSAAGANYVMEHGKTALIGETPGEAAEQLLLAEDPAVREQLAQAAHRGIARFFPDAAPRAFWRRMLPRLTGAGPAEHDGSTQPQPA